MAVGLLLATGAFYWAAYRALEQPLSPSTLELDLLFTLAVVVLTGTSATLMGAWYFTSSAVRPVAEITAQATRIEAGTLDQRIVAHADTEEYEGLVAVLNRMLERLERAFVAQRRLTADVSHELRTPLTALRGEIEVALRAPRSPREYERVLRSGLEEIDGLTELCEDLLLVTRAEARLLSPQRTPTDIDALVEERLDALHRRLEERGLTVSRSLHVGHTLRVDPELIRHLVDHLLDNAVRDTPEGGTIGVRLGPTPAGSGVRLVVENSGSGIPATDLPHLFEPFYRADPARTRGDGGSGLGLALVSSIAQLHGGAAYASSVPGQSTRFEVDIPETTAN
jgi:heavy metal sensor kinase